MAAWNDADRTWSTIFDIDYADGLSRADTTISVYDESGNLVLIARDSNIEDDQPAAGQGTDTDDLSRGSVGKLDPFIGSVQMPAGIVPANSSRTYYIAVCSNAQLPTAMNATFTANPAQPLIRLEPVNSVQRITEDHIGFSGYWTGMAEGRTRKVSPEQSLFNESLTTNVVPYELSDVVLFVSQGNRLRTIDAFTGRQETDIGALSGGSNRVLDIAMRSDGQMFGTETQVANPDPANLAGRLVEIDPGNAAQTVLVRRRSSRYGGGVRQRERVGISSNGV